MGVNETGTITLRILAQDLASGNIGRFLGGIDAIARKGGLMGSVLQGVGQSFGQMLNPMMIAGKLFDAAGQAIGSVVTALDGAGAAWRAEQADIAVFNNTLAHNIEHWRAYTGVIDDAISAGQRLGFSDDEQRAALSKLVTVTRSAARATDLNRWLQPHCPRRVASCTLRWGSQRNAHADADRRSHVSADASSFGCAC